ncbi:MAG: outer membrane beta-barrel protein [Alphaproteobacteria bacterium]|nr:outer membrane beta-barrel protein [Alphaproteobacteria bacterium]
MKKYIFTTLFALILLPHNATALTPYFSTGMTGGFQNSGKHASTAYSTLWTMTFGIKYGLTDNIAMRNEIEYAKSDYNFTSDVGGINYEYDASAQIYMGNIIAEFRPVGFSSSLYAGFSAGTTNYETTLHHPFSAPTESFSTFTYGATAGVSLNLIAGLYVDLGLRYLTTADAGDDGNLTTTAGMHIGF